MLISQWFRFHNQLTVKAFLAAYEVSQALTRGVPCVTAYTTIWRKQT